MLDLVNNFQQLLDEYGVIYCHWKSNNALDRTGSGLNDIDILIHHSSTDIFIQLLKQLGFKQAFLQTSKDISGISNYYGYDAVSNTIIHVHVHYRLIVGGDLTKNYHLPVERAFLAKLHRKEGFWVPDPHVEYVSFVLRMVLKFSLISAWLGNGRYLSSIPQKEYDHLVNLVDKNTLSETLTEQFPFLSHYLFTQCVVSLHHGNSIWQRWQTRHILQKQMSGFIRISRWQATINALWYRLNNRVCHRFIQRISGKRLATGGQVIAFVGGDGSGKSTVSKHIYKWLSKNLAVVYLHMGKPPQSFRTRMINNLLKITSRLPKRIVGVQAIHNHATAFQAVFIAWDRFRNQAKAQKLASDGILVICDRYPLPDIQTMDGPKIRQWVEGQSVHSRLSHTLIRWEETYYQRMATPDQIIALSVTPEIAISRKTDHDIQKVTERAQEIQMVAPYLPNAFVIDATSPVDEVLHRTKTHIWSIL